jgi:hypothetical protein
MPASVYNILLDQITKSAEYKDKIITLPDDDMISAIEIEYLYYGVAGSSEYPTQDNIWKSFVEEYNSLSDDEKAEYKLRISTNYYSSSNALIIRVNGYYISRKRFYSSYPLLPEYMPKTLALAANRINFAYIGSDPERAFDEYYDGLTKALTEDFDEFSLGINMRRNGDDQHYGKYATTSAGYKNIVKFLAESSGIFDFENAEKQLYRIDLYADIYSYHSDYDKKYTNTIYYNNLEAYIMLTDEEAQKIIDYIEKGKTPYFDIEK